MKQALIFQPDEHSRKHAETFMNALGINVRTVGEKELSKPIAELLGMPVFASAGGDEPLPPLFRIPPVTVLAGFSEEEIDGFLAAKRAAGITGTGMLAVVTPVNFSWPMGKLALELLREHEEIRKQEKP